MACTSCKKPASKCGCDKEIDFCGCSTKHDAKCVIYDSISLQPLGVVPGNNVEEIIKKINDHFRAVEGRIEDSFSILNIGGGADFYAGVSPDGIHLFRSLTSNQSVSLSQKTEEVEVAVNPDWLKTFIKEFLTSNEGQQFFISYFTSLITSGSLDICELIQECIPKVPTHSNPLISGDVVYSVPNRRQDFYVKVDDIKSKFSDVDGDSFIGIQITGGNLSNIYKTVNGVKSPLSIGDMIKSDDINSIEFDGLDQDAGYTQIIEYKAIDSAGGISN